MSENNDNQQRPPQAAAAFALFMEIGIISQLNRASVETHLPDGLLYPHFAVLSHLDRLGDGQTPLAIARAMQSPKTSMTHTLAGLEKRGLIEIRPNPADGRSKHAWITEQGRALKQATFMAIGKSLAGFVDQFPQEKIAPLVAELAEIRKWLDSARG